MYLLRSIAALFSQIISTEESEETETLNISEMEGGMVSSTWISEDIVDVLLHPFELVTVNDME